ncbi:MAG TPA: hypothetical protein VL996_08640 [Methylocella sp.]|nr:hypothetical protein [Methylocella sp.]
MRTVQTSLLAGAALIVFAGVAQSQSPGTHVLTIHLPGGGTEQIRYSGDVPPEIFLRPDAALADSPSLFPAFGPETSFEALDQISREMDQRAARLLEQAEAMTKQLPANDRLNKELIEAQSGRLPEGGHSYTFVSTMSADGICGRSVEITSSATGGQPHVVTQNFGHCGSGPKSGSISVPTKPRHRPDTIMASAQGGQLAEAAGSDMVQHAAWRQ